MVVGMCWLPRMAWAARTPQKQSYTASDGPWWWAEPRKALRLPTAGQRCCRKQWHQSHLPASGQKSSGREQDLLWEGPPLIDHNNPSASVAKVPGT